MLKNKVLKITFIFLAFIFLGLGCIGVVLPVLPTTPFLLAASFFFTKGSDRFNRWFISTSLYKNYLENFVKTRAMTSKSKLKILIPVSIVLIISFFSVDNFYLRGVIIFLFLLKEYYFKFHIKTIAVEIEGKRKSMIDGDENY